LVKTDNSLAQEVLDLTLNYNSNKQKYETK
jgi:hypothetical protein